MKDHFTNQKVLVESQPEVKSNAIILERAERSELIFYISSEGSMRFIYTDEFKHLLDGSISSSIKRVSHVEPVSGELKWTADMSPINGPVLGPFDTRTEALEAEVDWLNKNYL